MIGTNTRKWAFRRAADDPSTLVLQPFTTPGEGWVGRAFLCYDTLDGPKAFFERVKNVSVVYRNETLLSFTGKQWSTWLVLSHKRILKDTGLSRLYIPLLEFAAYAGEVAPPYQGVRAKDLLVRIAFDKENGDETEHATLLAKVIPDSVENKEARGLFGVFGVSCETLSHGSDAVETRITVPPRVRPRQLAFHVPGANHCVKGGCVGGAYEFESAYEASVLEKVLNGAAPTAGGHVFTHTLVSPALDGAPGAAEEVSLLLRLDGDAVPDGATLETFVYGDVELRHQ